jgi:Mn-dependent DtxR family transcriptional regulator
MERAKVKKHHYDDETLERMKRYYKIDDHDDHDDLLRFIKTHGLKDYNFEIDHS